MDHKQEIIRRFEENVKGHKFDKQNYNGACGVEGHWLEEQMGIIKNSYNKPDLFDYEQKKESDKISFGDWSASSYYFKNKNNKMSRTEFIKTFGSPNPKKNKRYSWSGSVFPKFGINYNYAGQRIIFKDDCDLVIQYSYINDTREDKINFDAKLKISEPIEIAIWKKSKLEKHVSDKFNKNGFYLLRKNNNNIYTKICFGKTINFEFFKHGLENRKIILDSGMYVGNNRNYSTVRAQKNIWNSLITEEY